MQGNCIDVPGYEDMYQASNMGRVRSLSRIVKVFNPRWGVEMNRPLKGKILKELWTEDGYPSVALSKEGEVWTREVHRIILLTFKGPCPEGMEGCCGATICGILCGKKWTAITKIGLER